MIIYTQSQIYKQRQVQESASTKSLFTEKSDNELFLEAPYTVFAKLDSDLISWVAYSMGRPRNIVWGTAIQNNATVSVEFGCNWNSLAIINKLIEIRKKNGYVAVSTYAKDLINHRVLEHLLLSAYNEGSNLEYGNVVLDKYQLQDLILQELDEQAMYRTTFVPRTIRRFPGYN